VKIRLVFVLLLLALAASACVPSGITVPDKLEDSGLVVGDLATEGLTVLPDSKPVINGKTYAGGMQPGGRLIVPLPPGEYTLDSIFASSTGMLGGSGVTQTTTQNLPIHQKFTIEKGRVTNVGLIVLLANKADPKKYGLYRLDNTAEMTAFLQSYYPALYGSLRDKSIRLAPGNLVPREQIPALRGEIASAVFAHLEGFLKPTTTFVSGGAGTLAQVERDAQGRALRLKLVDTGTLERLTSAQCATTEGRAACVVGKQLMSWSPKGRGIHPLPALLDGARGVYVFKDAGVVLVDGRLNFYSSVDDGVTWKTYAGIARDRPIEPSIGARFSSGANRFYASVPDAKALLVSGYDPVNYSRVGLPSAVDFVGRVAETASGVVMGPEFTVLSNSRLAFGQIGGTAWEIRKIPATFCLGLVVEDRNGDRLRAYCGDKTWRSEDAGRSWRVAP
jgi:hypothetical protein